MRIAFVRTASNQLTLGAYNIQEIGLAKALLKHGVSTDFYARFSNLKNIKILENNEKGTIKLIPLHGFNIYKEIMFYPFLQKALFSENYDFVQLEDDSQVMVPFLLRKLSKHGINTILWQGMYRNFDGAVLSRIQKIYDFFFINWINRYSSLKLAKTMYAKKYLLEKGYTDIELLPVGLDKISNKIDSDLTERVLKFKKSMSKVLLYVGTIDKRRDVFFLIKILNQLKLKGYGLIIVGDGPFREKVLARISELNMEKYVMHFKSLRNEQVNCLFENSDMFLLPTKYEIYGMVILEALNFGLPVVSSKEAGPHTILNNPRLGVCVDLVEEEWINAIQMYSKKFNTKVDSNYRKNIVKNRYNWDKIAENYYQKLMKYLK